MLAVVLRLCGYSNDNLFYGLCPYCQNGYCDSWGRCTNCGSDMHR